jgi:hypothetical protein
MVPQRRCHGALTDGLTICYLTGALLHGLLAACHPMNLG